MKAWKELSRPLLDGGQGKQVEVQGEGQDVCDRRGYRRRRLREPTGKVDRRRTAAEQTATEEWRRSNVQNVQVQT